MARAQLINEKTHLLDKVKMELGNYIKLVPKCKLDDTQFRLITHKV